MSFIKEVSDAVTAKGTTQSLADRIQAAKHTVSGSNLSKTICKATTEEIMGPKKKHIDCEYYNISGNQFPKRRSTVPPAGI